MKKNLFLTTLLLASCSSGPYRPESFDDKIARFTPANTNENSVPNFVVDESKLQSSSGRQIASVDKAQSSHSNKHLYFMTLFEQYQGLLPTTTVSLPTINQCPSFYNTWLSLKHPVAQAVPISAEITPEMLNNPAAHPELMLPISNDPGAPSVREAISSNPNLSSAKIINMALNTHLLKMNNELQSLCEYGSSDNYFAFENLMNIIKDQKQNFTASKNNVQVLLKTTIFSNMALMSSLKSNDNFRNIASEQDNNSQQIVNRLGQNWIKNYFSTYK
jgi:hypothetical protein